MKAVLILAALLALGGCNATCTPTGCSEIQAHDAFRFACERGTLRHTMTTQGDTAEFHATCKVSK